MFYYLFHIREGMKVKEFVNLKIDWLIENNRSDLIENFLKQNQDFEEKVD